MNRFFSLTDEFSARLLSADASGMTMQQWQAKLGEVLTNTSTRTMSATEISSNIEQALKHGYREVTEAEFNALQTQLAGEFQQKVVEPAEPNAYKAAWETLEPEFHGILRNRPAEYLSTQLRNFWLYDAPVQLPNDLKLSFNSRLPTPQTASRNLIFRNGLEINGNFDAGDNVSEIPLLVIVQGDLHAKNLILTGWTELVVTGNVMIGDALLAIDGEAGGRLHVLGDLIAPRIFGGMMYHIEVAGRIDGHVFWSDDDEPSLPNSLLVPSSLSHAQASDWAAHTPLVAEAYFADSNWATGEEVVTLNLDVSQMVELLRSGKQIFRQ